MTTREPTKAETKEMVDELLIKLERATTRQGKQHIRTQLRALGHRGGLRKKKTTKKKKAAKKK